MSPGVHSSLGMLRLLLRNFDLLYSGTLKDYSLRPPRLLEAILLDYKVLGGLIVWTSLGPLPRWVPGPTTRWAPGTTRLALHGTCWREAQGLRRRSTRIGSCTCPALYRGLLDVLD
jgi:hypothetical protein